MTYFYIVIFIPCKIQILTIPTSVSWTHIRRGVTRLDGARRKKQVWRPHVPIWILTEAKLLYCRKYLWYCWDFRCPPQWFSTPEVIWRPEIVLAPGDCYATAYTQAYKICINCVQMRAWNAALLQHPFCPVTQTSSRKSQQKHVRHLTVMYFWKDIQTFHLVTILYQKCELQ